MSDETTGRFALLFAGRTDVYGRGGDNPGCEKQPVTNETFQFHLSQKHSIPIGIYTTTDRNTCYWGCADIDDGDFDAAKSLRSALAAMGICGWIEVSKSKGFHVWVFALNEVPAKVMRRALLVAYDAIGLQVKEINPKQEELDASMPYGSYVRLPYPGGNAEMVGVAGLTVGRPPDRQVVLDENNEPMTLRDFVEAAVYHRTPERVLRKWAALWSPPPKTGLHHHYTTAINTDVGELTKRLPSLAFTVWQKGPLEGRDRSNTLVKLGYLMYESGAFTPSEALVILTDADVRWGGITGKGPKFADRVDGDQRLQEIVTHAWA